eukprot:333046_1
MVSVATQLYAVISIAAVLIFRIKLFYKLWHSFKLHGHSSSTLKKSVLWYFTFISTHSLIIFIQRTMNLLILISEQEIYDAYDYDENQRKMSTFSSILATTRGSSMIVSNFGNNAISIFFLLNIKHIFKDTFLSVNSSMLNILFAINLFLSIPASIADCMYRSIRFFYPSSFNYQLIFYIGTYPYLIIFVIYIFTLNIIIMNRLYRFTLLTAQNDRSLSSEINITLLNKYIKHANLYSFFLIAAISFVLVNKYTALSAWSYTAYNLFYIITTICPYLLFEFHQRTYQITCKYVHKLWYCLFPNLVDNSTNKTAFSPVYTTVTSTFELMSVSYKDYCSKDIDCEIIDKLCKVLMEYNDHENIETESLEDILNNFHHTLHFHDDHNTFQQIYNIIDSKHHKNASECIIFTRNNRRRLQHNTEQTAEQYDGDTPIMSVIMDKLHSFYYHSYDTGFRTCSDNYVDKINERDDGSAYVDKYDLNFDDDIAGDDDKMYSFGVRFDYEHKDNYWSVVAHYQSLKDELLNNDICCILIEDYNIEYEKCSKYMNSNYIKKLKNRNISIELSFSYTLCLLIYCNYDLYQRKWSESFRRIPVNETDSSLKERHSYFYHSSINLRNLVEYFGDSLVKNKNESFYHGVSQITYFTKTIATFNSPMSTSEEVIVAMRFSNNCGLILQLQHSFSVYPLKSKYFRCSFLSDYVNEKECLFIGGIPAMIITNIINMNNGEQYNQYINALNIINGIFNGTYEENNDDSLELCIELLSYQLNLSKSNNINVCKLPNYVCKLLYEYCVHLDNIMIFWHHIQKVLPFQQLLCLQKQCLFFDLDILLNLFPNMQQIEYFN